jgi:uncharacterized protein
MPTLDFAGHTFRVVGNRALFWPARSAVLVADMHLEKASWFAVRGQMLPPYDSHDTLIRLGVIIAQTGAREVWSLGDNFHDDAGPDRMTGQAQAALAALTTQTAWHWITGNHDAHLPAGVGGTILAEALVGGILLRHEAIPSELRPEISGHFHPKYRAKGARGGVTRACFVAHETKLIMPSFGALTGGLSADHAAISAALSRAANALIPSGNKLHRFPLPRTRASSPKP